MAFGQILKIQRKEDHFNLYRESDLIFAISALQPPEIPKIVQIYDQNCTKKTSKNDLS